MNQLLCKIAVSDFRDRFGRAPTVIAYAPGRVEVLGNHTDYNEGFVLSAAINFGTFFLCAPRSDHHCHVTADNFKETATFDAAAPMPAKKYGWANYVKGVHAGLHAHSPAVHGFDALFIGDVPLGAGLSSSAALEMAAGLALVKLYGLDMSPLALARIGQMAEHHFAGVKCGLLDQISSLYGKENALVETDFRSLTVKTVPFGSDACLLLCNTHSKHALVDGEYNQRRAACESATAHFAKKLPHPVKALRDVSWAEWKRHKRGLSKVVANRAAHPIGENERVLEGARRLAAGDMEGFGKLMFEAHKSSREYFENSCPELNRIVEAAAHVPGVMGARLTGGGFGGSVVVLVHPRDAETAGAALSSAYTRHFKKPCDTCVVTPSAGAQLVKEAV